MSHVNWPVTTKKKKTETLKTLQNRSLYVKMIGVLFEPAIQMRKGELWAQPIWHKIEISREDREDPKPNLV
jgi:hypothetical protein